MGLAIDELANKVYISSTGSNAVFVLDRATGIMETIAGIPFNLGTNIGSTAKASKLYYPRGLFFDSTSNYLYIAGMLCFSLLTSCRCGYSCSAPG
jgi:DNA-binding beta-propeller fold protein YncE